MSPQDAAHAAVRARCAELEDALSECRVALRLAIEAMESVCGQQVPCVEHSGGKVCLRPARLQTVDMTDWGLGPPFPVCDRCAKFYAKTEKLGRDAIIVGYRHAVLDALAACREAVGP